MNVIDSPIKDEVTQNPQSTLDRARCVNPDRGQPDQGKKLRSRQSAVLVATQIF